MSPHQVQAQAEAQAEVQAEVQVEAEAEEGFPSLTSIMNMNMNKDFLSSPTFKLILLTGLVLQNSANVLVGRYTRSSVPTDELYSVNHLILIAEIGKLLLSCVFEYFTTNGKLMESIQTNILDRPKDALKILVPALLYLVQNSLLFVALSNLTAPIFQVTYQAKLVTTAMVSVAMLNRKYTLQQWICLVTLSLGVAIVVLGESSTGSASSSSTEASAEAPHQSLVVGLMAVSVACMSSALAGVYFEKVIKTAGSENHKPVSVWMRNIQLAFFTICTAFAQGLWTSMHGDATSAQVANTYFHGFTGLVWFLVVLQAGGGLLVAAVIKYADNVLKGLATGVSVCFATAFSSIFFGTTMTAQFTVGATVILISVYLFSNPLTKSQTTGAGGGTSTSPTSGSSGINKEMGPLLPSDEKD